MVFELAKILLTLNVEIEGVCHSHLAQITILKSLHILYKIMQKIRYIAVQKGIDLWVVAPPLIQHLGDRGRWISMSSRPGLQSELQDKLQSYTEKPCLENQKKNK